MNAARTVSAASVASSAPPTLDNEEEEAGQHLYVMANSRLPELKIGRSCNVWARAAQLQASQPFTVKVLALFPNVGHLEPLVHKMLSSQRLADVAGREWFACTLREALDAIALTLATYVD